jgi:hypothetical protein
VDNREKDDRSPSRLGRQATDERRAKFAREIARAEFGRFYWDERQAGEMRRAARPKPRPPARDGG